MSEARTCPSCGHVGSPDDVYCSECGFHRPPAGVDPPLTDDPLLGRALPGGYRIVEILAEGSMGRVYLAEQAALGRAVAVKVMNPGLVGSVQMVDRFKTEARAASALNHPNCVRVYDFGETHDGRPYLVMELLKGQDLEAVLAQEPLQPVTRVLDIALQILSALEEAHDLGVVHRDLKPANVFVLPQRGGGDLVKVVDFGLAKLKSGLSSPEGLVFGTPEYITPEQAMAKDTDNRTDLYACGVMLFEMLSGSLPFRANDPNELLKMHAYEEPPKLSEIAPERAMFGLDMIVERALMKDPADRFPSASAFAEALREIVAYRTGDRTMSDRKSWIRASRKACAMCGNLMPVTARFCGECGISVGTERDSVVGPLPGPQQVRVLEADPARPENGAKPAAAPSRVDGRQAPTRQPGDSAQTNVQDAIKAAEASGDANSALVFLEQIAGTRMAQGDARAAIAALRRGIEVAKADLDRGELDDPIHAVAIFSAKLGDAYLEAGDLEESRRAFKDALTLSRDAASRAKLWLSLSRVARSLGHHADAVEYLEAAEREAARAGETSRSSDPPTPRRKGASAGSSERSVSSRRR